VYECEHECVRAPFVQWLHLIGCLLLPQSQVAISVCAIRCTEREQKPRLDGFCFVSTTTYQT
jgi:hypothetical protein